MNFYGGAFTAFYELSDFCRLVTGDIPDGHFTHVFVDEAGHSVETESLVPLAGTRKQAVCFSVIELNVVCVGYFLFIVL